METVRAAFVANDADGNGILDKAELASVLMKCNPDMSVEATLKVIEAADANQDGMVDYDEFIAWVFHGPGEDLTDLDLHVEIKDEDHGEARTERVVDWRSNEQKFEALRVACGPRTPDAGFPESVDLCPESVSTRAKNDSPWTLSWAPVQIAPALGSLVPGVGEAKLFSSISPNCMAQGFVGDCWLLAAISNLAEFPQLLRDCFPGQHRPSADGKYVVRLFDPADDMKEHHVEINDLIPYYSEFRRMNWKPAFARPTGNELFALLLEKAAASFLHSGKGGGKPEGWLSLHNGHVTFGWMLLTGVADCSILKPAWWGKWKEWTTKGGRNRHSLKGITYRRKLTKDKLFEALQEESALGSLVACCMAGSGKEKLRESGLVEGHAYSVLEILQTSIGRLLKLRNPWGNDKEWKGACSDAAGFWESAEGRKLGNEVGYSPDPNDGQFFMKWEDFIEVFDQIYICRTRGAQRRAFPVEFAEHFSHMVDRYVKGSFGGLTMSEYTTLQRLWDKYAEVSGGFVSEGQLGEILDTTGVGYEDLAATYAGFDKDEDGKVNWSDFSGCIEMMLSQLPAVEK